MMNYKCFNRFLYVVSCLVAAPVLAQGLQKNQPIEITSDKLDVMQDQHKAIFTGNVIAVQGTSNLRSEVMTVFYRDSSTNKAATAAPAAPAAPGAANAQGIYRIEAKTGVVFTTPTDTATGDTGIYNVDDDTIDLTGGNVTLTQGQNILKGTRVVHNMTTGRSIITGSGGVPTEPARNGGTAKGGRVHGLFIPQGDDKKAGGK